MAFVVEDGTGLTNANAYIAVAFADAYFADRGIEAWSDIDDSAIKQQAIVRATDYLDLRYRDAFKGDPATDAQALLWPRVAERASCVLPGFYSVGSADSSFPTAQVPVAVQKACAEYALRALTTTLAPDPVMDETGRPVASTSEKVGPIEEKIEYVKVTAPSQFVPYPAADNLLRPVLKPTSGRVVRA